MKDKTKQVPRSTKQYVHRSTSTQGNGTNELSCTIPYHLQRNNSRNIYFTGGKATLLVAVITGPGSRYRKYRQNCLKITARVNTAKKNCYTVKSNIPRHHRSLVETPVHGYGGSLKLATRRSIKASNLANVQYSKQPRQPRASRIRYVHIGGLSRQQDLAAVGSALVDCGRCMCCMRKHGSVSAVLDE